MRLRLALAPVAFLPLLVTAAVVGCDDPTTPGVDLPEAGGFDGLAPPPGPDGSIPDGSIPDALPADVDAGPRGIAVVIADREGKPVAGATVVFHDATGAVIDTATTDAAGRAYRPGVGPQMVTAAVGTAATDDTNLHTWTGVEDGDVLRMVVEARGAQRAAPSYNVTFPGAFAGASSYTVDVEECQAFSGDPPTPQTLFLYPGCARATNALLGTARDQAGSAIAFSSLKGLVTPPDAGSAPAALPAWAAPTPVVLGIENPPGVRAVRAVYTQIVGTVPYRQEGFFQGDGGAPFGSAAGFPDAVQALAVNGGFGGSTQAVGKRVAPTASIIIDFAQSLPAITGATNDLTDRARPTIAWKSDQPLTSSDGGGVRIRWFRNNESTGNWTFTVAPTATSVKAPALPAALAAWLPQAQDGVEEPTVAFGESDLLPGYAQFRSIATIVLGPDLVVQRVFLPANGNVRVTAYSQPAG
jgi:hypothetical protein